jgi:SAM-dependent methyltransferase
VARRRQTRGGRCDGPLTHSSYTTIRDTTLPPAASRNGVINLCADKRRVFQEIMRVLRPGGRLQFADIATGKAVPEAAIRNIDLWTD